MAELSPEEKERIFQEQMAHRDAVLQADRESARRNAPGKKELKIFLYILLGLTFSIIFFALFFPDLAAITFDSIKDSLSSVNVESKDPAYTPAPEPELNRSIVIDNLKWLRENYATYATGTITNNTNRNYSYVQVEINIYDGEGALIGSTIDNVINLMSGETWKFKALVYQPGAKTFKVMGVSGY